MKSLIVLALLGSVSAFADTYKCTFNTHSRVVFDDRINAPIYVDEVVAEDVEIKVGSTKEIEDPLYSKKVVVSLEDGDTARTIPEKVYEGMNLLHVRFFVAEELIAFANVSTMKGARKITAQAGHGSSFVNVNCNKVD